MQQYTALIIDVQGSKEMPDAERFALQKTINTTIEGLNNAFGSALKFEIVFSAGDEVQGLFESLASAYLYWRLFSNLLYPTKFRAGLGVGEWSVRTEGGLSTAQDGSAYHNARTAISSVQENQGYNVLLYSGQDNTKDSMVNSAINYANMLESRQKIAQKQVYVAAECLHTITVEGNINKEALIGFIIHANNAENANVNWKNLEVLEDCLFIGKENVGTVATSPFSMLYVEKTKNNSFFEISGVLEYGMHTAIGRLLGKSSRNAGKLVHSGKTEEARNAAISTVRMMRIFYENS